MLNSLRDLEKSLKNPLSNPMAADAVLASSVMAESRARASKMEASRAPHEETPPNTFNAGTESSMLNSGFLNSQSSVMPRMSFTQPRIIQGTDFCNFIIMN